MSTLSRQEIILLNSLNYLDIEDKENSNIGEVIEDILMKPGALEELTRKKPASMSQDAWREVLEQIQQNEKLCSLTIVKQSQGMGYNPQGLNAVCFLDKDTKEATFVFRGTGGGEWLDNGLAFAGADSPQQLQALEYFERSVKELKLVEKNYQIDVTGHSKGGNKAQFITINSDIVRECISFDGQGFSNEALEKYKDGIKRNRHKITTIAADKDYVHCLGNEIAEKKEIYESIYTLKKFANHHSPNAILTNNGLTPRVEKIPWQNIMINRYSRHLMKLEPELKKEIFTSFMGLAQMKLGKNVAVNNERVPSTREAWEALSEASVEFKRWFKQDRNQFTTRQKLILHGLGSPMIKGVVPLVYLFKYKSFAAMEERVLGTLRNEIKQEFGNSMAGIQLQKTLDLIKTDLEKAYKIILEDIDKTPNTTRMMPEAKIQQDLLKRELFCYLKNGDDLLNIIDNVKDIQVKNNCQDKLKEVTNRINSCLEHLNKNVKEYGHFSHPELDDKNKYLIDKLNSSFSNDRGNFVRDRHKEENINLISGKIIDSVRDDLKRDPGNKLVNRDNITASYEITRFCQATKLEQSKEIGPEPKQKNVFSLQGVKALDKEIKEKDKALDNNKRKEPSL